MTSESVQYKLESGIATITIDDGKRNALSPALLQGVITAIDRAEADGACIIITGRESVLSAGFDLKVMQRGGKTAISMLSAGYALPARLLSYPHPVVVACNGHVLAMGVFMMLSADYVIGTSGDFKIAANEVAIGMTMPRVAAAVLKNRLTPAAYQRAVTLSEYFDTEAAQRAGFFDELVAEAELMPRALQCIKAFQQLDPIAHVASKRRIRKSLLRSLRWGRPLDLVDAMLQGLRRARRSA